MALIHNPDKKFIRAEGDEENWFIAFDGNQFYDNEGFGDINEYSGVASDWIERPKGDK